MLHSVIYTLLCKTVIMQGDSRCDKCNIKADRLFVRERAQLKDANVIARAISLKDTAAVSGTFFAQDSLEVSLTRKQDASLNLILQGRKTGEVEYTGFMEIQKLKASRALVIFMGDNWDETAKGVPVNVAKDVEIRGALISRGMTDFRGKLTGMLITYNLGFYEEHTLWRGFLRDGRIIGDTTIHTFLPDIVYLGGEASYEK